MMKKVLLLFLLITGSFLSKAQCLFTNYVSCNDSIGSFSFDPSCYPNSIFVWSTGDTSNTVFVKTGTYTVNIIDTINTSTIFNTLTMYHDTWHLGISPLTNDSSNLYFWAELPSCKTSRSIHPSCNPFWYYPYCVVWEDSIPIDTLKGVDCAFWSYPGWHYAKPGHYYDISIVDTICHCFEATWMTSPPGTFYYRPTGIDEIHSQKLNAHLSPNPFHTTATLKIDDLRSRVLGMIYDLKIFDVMGRLVREQIINNQSSIINRENFGDGIYFYQLQTPNSKPITGKFVVD